MEMIKKFFRKIFPVSKRLSIIVAKMRLASPDKKLINYLEDTRGEKKFLVLGVPEHANIGDHAIACAEKKFLLDYFPGIGILEVPIDAVFSSCRYFVRYKRDCIICCHGGGNMGTLYVLLECMFHLVLKYFMDQPVIVFPQTVFWDKTSSFYKKLPEAIKLYEQHQNLNVFIRDGSIEFMDRVINYNQKINVFNVPDIVLYLNETAPKTQREGVLFCMRADEEKTISRADIDRLMLHVRAKGDKVGFTDTVHAANFPMQCRDWILKNKFDEFRRSKLVITDRLHGMLFAAITGTPCIALNNVSSKVKGVFDLWLKDLKYIRFTNNVDEALEIYNNVNFTQENYYDPNMFKQHWDTIADTIAGAVK